MEKIKNAFSMITDLIKEKMDSHKKPTIEEQIKQFQLSKFIEDNLMYIIVGYVLFFILAPKLLLFVTVSLVAYDYFKKI